MKWLVTGAGGFLGRRVVEKLLLKGDQVRVLVRPASDLRRHVWQDRVEVFRGDLRRCGNLDSAFEGVDGLIHLAAAVTGSPEEQFASTVVGTEKLLEAMASSTTRRLLLVSSFSVYDWKRSRHRLDESAPLERDRLYERDGYAIAKTWQERLVRQFADRHDWDLTILRPGFIWGPGQAWCVGLGEAVGKAHVIIGPTRRLPLTYVDNCADCVATSAGDPHAIGQTFNVVDAASPSAWRLAGDYLSRSGQPGIRLPVPYHFGLATAFLAQGVSRLLFGTGGKLPGVLVPYKYRARFRPGRFPHEKLTRTIGWRPSVDYQDALSRTHSAEPIHTEYQIEKVSESEVAHA